MAKASGGTRKSMPSANPQLKRAGNTEKQTEHPLDDGYFVSDSEKKAYIMSKGGFDSAETDVILKTISNWAGSGYKNIRRWMLGRDEKMADIVREDMKKKAATLERFIEKMPKWNGGTTYRGMESTEKRAFFEALDIGDQWDAKSLNSW